MMSWKNKQIIAKKNCETY